MSFPVIYHIKKLYVAVLMFFVGRALQAASHVDSGIIKEVSQFPERFLFKLKVLPDGPMLTVRKQSHQLKYLFRDPADENCDLVISIKHLEAAWLLFSFQESTAVSFARNRMIVKGDLIKSMAVVRCLNNIEVYLLPKFIARLAVKRYPRWPFFRKIWNRTHIYLRTLLGF